MNSLKKQMIFLGAAFAVILADQLSKWAVTEHIIRPLHNGMPLGFMEWLANAPPRLDYAQTALCPVFNIVMVWNKGVSFGILNHNSDYGPLLLIALSLCVTLVFLIWLFRTTSTAQLAGIALVIGGALGNVIDRIRFGAVIDFLDLHVADTHWPAFNVADSCIVVGISLLVVYSVFFEERSHA